MYTENTYRDIENAKAEAEYIFGGGDGKIDQWIAERPDGTFYIISDRCYKDIPYSDEPVARLTPNGWTEYPYIA